MKHAVVGMIVAACAAHGIAPACGQSYPSRPVRIVVPYPPGGGTDIVARTLAQKLTETLGQTFVVDNRAGANGIIGTDQVAKSKPDGYTVLITIATHAINPTLYAKLPYDTGADLVPVSLLAEYPFVITVHPSVPVRNVKELIAFAKARPNQLPEPFLPHRAAGHARAGPVVAGFRSRNRDVGAGTGRRPCGGHRCARCRKRAFLRLAHPRNALGS